MYEATRESISTHQAPDWFHDAKLGIFVHWGLYSVPGWAPQNGTPHDVVAREGWNAWFARNPYAEWYGNSIRIPDSPSAAYHAAHYSADFTYEQFAPQFDAASKAWDPGEWAALFATAGARYAVLTTKHHDGFLLWPSIHPNPHQRGYQATRDLVGEVTAAVRAQGLRMGLYYSAGLDWTFNARPIVEGADLVRAIPQQAEYVSYATTHLRELIDRYAPSVLWNDIGYPHAANLYELFAYYYNRVPDGVINDRFGQPRPDGTTAVPSDPLAVLGTAPTPHLDFRTPEYTTYSTIAAEKWESTRGLGHSFGYNRNEAPEHMLSTAGLIHLFVDIVSKNGNLLLNVGPTATGLIPTEQRRRLLALGEWLGTNGAAIYRTRPWVRAEGRTSDGIPVRFTQHDGVLYAILLGTPPHRDVAIQGLTAEPGTTIRLLGQEALATWLHWNDHLAITLPESLSDAPAHVLRIAPQPR